MPGRNPRHAPREAADVAGAFVACVGGIDCYRPSGRYGVLSSTSGALQPAYKATIGYDLATGMGSVNVANLIARWAATLALPKP